AVFDGIAPEGWFLFQRVNQFTVDYFHRNASGEEAMQPDAEVRWEILDVFGKTVRSGTAKTSENGWASFIPSWPASTIGRVTIVASVSSPDGTVRDSSRRMAGPDAGVFGVIEDADSGTIAI